MLFRSGQTCPLDQQIGRMLPLAENSYYCVSRDGSAQFLNLPAESTMLAEWRSSSLGLPAISVTGADNSALYVLGLVQTAPVVGVARIGCPDDTHARIAPRLSQTKHQSPSAGSGIPPTLQALQRS